MDDDKLAQLLSLGFDLDTCKQALSQYNDVQDAANWILTTELPPSGGPSLTFPGNVYPPESNAAPLTGVQPRHTELQRTTAVHDQAAEKEIERQKELSMKMLREAKRTKRLDHEARQRALLEIKEDRERQKLIHGSNRSINQPEKNNESEKARVLQETQKQKRSDREARLKVLEDIKQDREDKKSHKGKVVAEPPKEVSQQQQKPTDDFSVVQFKLSDGTTVRERFSTATPLEVLYDFVTRKEADIGKPLVEGEILSLISTFPKRVFAKQEKDITVLDAGLVPKVSLNVSRTRPDDREVVSNVHSESSWISDRDMVDSAPGQNEEEDVEMEDRQDSNMSADEEADNLLNHPDNRMPINSHRFPQQAQRTPFIRRDRITNPHWNWGSEGHRLMDAQHDQHDQQDQQDQQDQHTEDHTVVSDENQRRQNLLSAIENRSRQPREEHSTSHGKIRLVRSLKDFCSVSVAALLTQPKAGAPMYLKSLMHATPEITQLVLSELINSRKLERSTMKRLADHCR
ncbi:hypothetical protein DFQ28_005742 [Apophysomyces sp. BC1034]|nr:hypothetical protein DFQ28_005742 [Apophysomyces sp. BC1034]